MVLQVQSLESVRTGQAVDAVVAVRHYQDGYTYVKELWHGSLCKVRDELSPGIWTLYGYNAIVDSDIVLEPSIGSKKIQKPRDPDTGVISLKEICCGIGGFSVGAAESGFYTSVFLDRSDIACQTINANGGRTLHADIAQRETRIAFHEVEHTRACLVTAGFPCQPYSRQGDGRGFMDARAHTLVHVLETTWFVQPEGLVLECVTEAERHPMVRALLAELAGKLGWTQHHLTLELAERWPCRRLRWWCVLVPERFSGRIVGWPKVDVKPRICDVIAEWPSWSQQEIDQLRWDTNEAQHFLDPSMGDDQRVLDLQGQAPTALHSWGSQLRSCPCGCRGPLSAQRLRNAGLRGFGVPLGSDGSFRHPHPQEVGLLNGLTVRLSHSIDLRAALCLVGQIASPLHTGQTAP